MSSIELKQRTGSIKLKQRSGSIKLKERTGRIELDPPNFYEKLLKQGLVAYYPFDGDVNDHAGDNNGTIYGDPQFVEGVSGQALSFDANAKVNAGSVGQFNSPFSVSVWIKPFEKPQALTGIIGNALFRGGGWIIGNLNETLTVSLNTNSAEYKIRLFNRLEPDKVCHVFLSFDGFNMSIYVNGSFQKQRSANITKNSTGLLIGRGTQGGWRNLFKGFVDQVRIYNRALSDLEIQKLYDLKV